MEEHRRRSLLGFVLNGVIRGGAVLNVASPRSRISIVCSLDWIADHTRVSGVDRLRDLRFAPTGSSKGSLQIGALVPITESYAFHI
jgi:hypothetical protein